MEGQAPKGCTPLFFLGLPTLAAAHGLGVQVGRTGARALVAAALVWISACFGGLVIGIAYEPRMRGEDVFD